MIRAGVSTACMYPVEVEEAFLQLAKDGVKCMEVFINSDCELKYEFIKNLKKISDFYNVKICSIHPFTCAIEPTMFFTQYPRRFFDALDYYKKYFEAMNILGAEIFVFHGNVVHHNVEESLYFERYKGLYDLGKKFGITVAQENVSRCDSGSLDFNMRMIKALGNDAKFVLDTKQAVRKGYDPYEFLDALGKHIVHVHISDHSEKGDCLLVGEGTLNFDKFINSLIKYSYTGSIILELYSSGYNRYTDLSQNLTYMENCLRQYC